MCVREGGRERESEREKETEIERERDRKRARETERERELCELSDLSVLQALVAASVAVTAARHKGLWREGQSEVIYNLLKPIACCG